MGAATETALPTQPRRATEPSGVHRPRRPQATPLYRLIEDHFEEFCTIYDERFSRRWGYWRKANGDCTEQPLEIIEPEAEAVRKVTRRWAELLRRILEVEPLRCPRCGETTMVE